MKLFTKNLRTLLTSKKRASEKGQSLAEMVIGMTILVMLMSGVVDIGRAYFAYVALEDAAGEAAVYMSAFPDCPYDGVDLFTGEVLSNDLLNNPTVDNNNPNGTTGWECDPPNNALWRLRNAGGTGGLINWSDPTKSEIVITCHDTENDVTISCASAGTNDLVIVTVTYQLRLLSPFIPDITGTPTIALTGTATNVISAPQ